MEWVLGDIKELLFIFFRYNNYIMGREEKASLLEMNKKVYEVKCHFWNVL